MRIFGRMREYFMGQPRPDFVFQASARWLAGIAVRTARGGARELEETFFLPLDPGVVEPAFDRGNVSRPGPLVGEIRAWVEKKRGRGRKAALLMPDPCFRVFVFQADSLPKQEEEREAFLRWKLGRLLPHMPSDAVLAYDHRVEEPPLQVLAGVAGKAVVREYEALLESAGLEVGFAAVPTLSLSRVVPPEREAGLVVNLESGHIGLLLLRDSVCGLYRQKLISAGAGGGGQDLIQAVQEIENTLFYLEDKEKVRVGRVWLRCGDPGSWEETGQILSEALPVPVSLIEPDMAAGLSREERNLFAPLWGEAL